MTNSLPRVSVVVPIYNQAHLVRECLTLNLENAGEATAWIIIDNNSDPETKAVLTGLARKAAALGHTWLAVTKSTNTGVAKAWNEGLRLSASSHVCILNNDCVLPPNWVVGLMAAETASGLGVLTPLIIEPPMMTPPYTLDYFKAHHARLGRRNKGRVREGLFGGVVFWAKRETFLMLGGFDEKFWLSLEDMDFLVRAIKANLRIGTTGDVVAFHYGGGTRKKMPLDETPNQIYFREKWGWNYADQTKTFRNKLIRSWRKRLWRFAEKMSLLQEHFPI
jgi:GT2 family glycosyltransferase